MGSIYILFCVNALMHNFYKWESHMHNPGMGSLLNFSEKTPTNIYIFVSPGIKFIGLCHNIRKEEDMFSNRINPQKYIIVSKK